MDEIKQVFMPKAEALLARCEFRSRRQGVDEDVLAYYSAKLALYQEAFSDAGDFYTFSEALIQGLYNNVVKGRLPHL